MSTFPTGCTRPRAGWYCTREPGHEGPCAARPIEDKVAEILAAHQPTTDYVRRLYMCKCGLEFHFIDAKAWHRHATAMIREFIR